LSSGITGYYIIFIIIGGIFSVKNKSIWNRDTVSDVVGMWTKDMASPFEGVNTDFTSIAFAKSHKMASSLHPAGVLSQRYYS